jgi:hypothetical protein
LAAWRGHAVDKVIQRSIDAHLERSNYNNPGDLKTLLQGCGLPPTLVDPYARLLAS